MPKLDELNKKERTEICRTIARAAYDCLAKKVDADGCVQGGTFAARVYKACSELGVVEDDEFYGNAFSPTRVEVLEGFEKTYEEALAIGAQYDELVCPLADVASDFAMKSESLVRMWCVARFVAALLADGPFADLRVTLCVAEDDDDEGAAEEEVRTAEPTTCTGMRSLGQFCALCTPGRGALQRLGGRRGANGRIEPRTSARPDAQLCASNQDDDSIIASSSDEVRAVEPRPAFPSPHIPAHRCAPRTQEEASSSDSGDDNGPYHDVEEVTPEEAEPADGPRRKKARATKGAGPAESSGEESA